MSDLDSFLASLNLESLKRVQGWELERHGALLFLSLGAEDGERYRIRFNCDGYALVAPDPVFVDSSGAKTDRSAWPRGDQYFDQYIKPPPNCFVCMPLSRTGLEKHKEWKSPGVDAWDPTKHSLMDLFNFLQWLLNSEHYRGRLA